MAPPIGGSLSTETRRVKPFFIRSNFASPPWNMKKCSASGARNKGDFCILRWYFLHFYINAFHVYIFPVTSVWITEHCSGDDIWRQGEPATRSRQSINQRKIIRNTLVPPSPEFTPPPEPTSPASPKMQLQASRNLWMRNWCRSRHSKNGWLQHFGQSNKSRNKQHPRRTECGVMTEILSWIKLCVWLFFYGFFYWGRVGLRARGIRKSLTKPSPSKWRQQSQMNENVKAKWLTKLITTKLQITQINLILCEFVFLGCCCFQCQWVEWLVSGQSFDSFSASARRFDCYLFGGFLFVC